MEAEERRRRAELEALIQAYYEYLRLQRTAQQTTQPTSPKLLGGSGGGGFSALFLGGIGATLARTVNQALRKNSFLGLPFQANESTTTSTDRCERLENRFLFPHPVLYRLFGCVQPITIFFGGSLGYPFSPHDAGPDPRLQTPVWVDNTRINHVFPYLGSTYHPYPNEHLVDVSAKQNQVNSATSMDFANNDLTVIGYSGGADSALIFANTFQANNSGAGRITGLALLEGTMTGSMAGGLQLHDEWSAIIDNLLRNGVNVYALNDNANDSVQWSELRFYVPPTDATGIFCYDSRPSQEHWDGGVSGQFGIGTNNSLEYRDFVLEWLNNPTPCSTP